MKKFLLLAATLIAFAPSAAAQSSGGGVQSYTQNITAQTADDAERVEKRDALPYIVNYREVRCFVNSATPVFFGSKENAVYPLCTNATSCPDGNVMSFPVRDLYAKVATTAVDITCIFLY